MESLKERIDFSNGEFENICVRKSVSRKEMSTLVVGLMYVHCNQERLRTFRELGRYTIHFPLSNSHKLKNKRCYLIKGILETGEVKYCIIHNNTVLFTFVVPAANMASFFEMLSVDFHLYRVVALSADRGLVAANVFHLHSYVYYENTKTKILYRADIRKGIVANLCTGEIHDLFGFSSEAACCA